MSNQTTPEPKDEPLRGSLDAKVRASALRGGLIPKGQQCPFAEPCAVKDDCPAARPLGNRVDYSCGMARFMDIFGRPNVPGHLPRSGGGADAQASGVTPRRG